MRSRLCSSAPGWPIPVPSATLHNTCAPDHSHFNCPSLDVFQCLNVFVAVRSPNLNTVLEVRHHQCWVRGDNYLLWLHYFWYKPGSHWPSCGYGHQGQTVGSCSASCWQTPPAPFPLCSLPLDTRASWNRSPWVSHITLRSRMKFCFLYSVLPPWCCLTRSCVIKCPYVLLCT